MKLFESDFHLHGTAQKKSESLILIFLLFESKIRLKLHVMLYFFYDAKVRYSCRKGDGRGGPTRRECDQCGKCRNMGMRVQI